MNIVENAVGGDAHVGFIGFFLLDDFYIRLIIFVLVCGSVFGFFFAFCSETFVAAETEIIYRTGGHKQ